MANKAKRPDQHEAKTATPVSQNSCALLHLSIHFFTMEKLLTAVVAELATRSISFLIDKYSKPRAPSMEETMQRLLGVLLRVRVVVEEAERRHITSLAMLQQLDMLRSGMYRGYYTVDKSRCRAHEEEKAKDHQHQVSHVLILSKFNPAKRFRCSEASTAHGSSTDELKQMLDSLNMLINDAKEFVVFLKNYPLMYRQPHSTHLFVEKCMFGRQGEMEEVINFLLQKEPPGGTENPGVLPIIGPARVGKSTLVEHVSCDERVRNHFSRIVFLSDNDLRDEMVTLLTHTGVVRYQNIQNFAFDERFLIIIELDGDLEESVWRRLHSSLKICTESSIKIIVTSRFDKIAILGTTQALRLKFLPEEPYWYFFKTIVFGSTDPEEQPTLASIAMGVAKELNGTFLGANVIGELLRSNVNLQFWCWVLTRMREYTRKHLSQFSEHPTRLFQRSKPIYGQIMAKTAGECLIYDCYQRTSLDQDGVPKINFQEILSGSARISGKFEALAWKSHIPPYYSYLFACQIQRPRFQMRSI